MEKKSKEINELWPEDKALFEKMKGNYVSDNERVFFENMYRKMVYEWTCAGDMILSERNNDDHIYIARYNFDEMEIGQGIGEEYKPELYTQTLSEALNANLKQLGYLERDITLLEWLRERDYNDIEYNHNFDDL